MKLVEWLAKEVTDDPRALRWFAEGFAARSGIEVELAIAPEIGRLREEMELTIFRVVQESLSTWKI